MKTANLLKMFVAVPLLPLLVIWTLWDQDLWWLVVVAGVALYFPIHQLGQGIGYHKLFSHRSFQPRPWYPKLATFLASISFYGDPLSAALVHRNHHRWADTDRDPHSPLHGRFHAYVGWIATYRPGIQDSRVIRDLMRDYPWMVRFHRVEWAVPWLFHSILYLLAPLVSCALLIACLLSVHNGLAVNAFSHDPSIPGPDQACDSPTLARWINPIFLHRYHHEQPRLADYSHAGVRDPWVVLIRRCLAQPALQI